ncbi:MAG: aminoacetone oxidase family FAD-binding enzyme [Verrucomicrobiales bacterium]|nr:aminoacetone oxidase family FAD-binding enzyme [Verrucomicrobiales bacterium]
MDRHDVVIVGGGAAGFFAAIACVGASSEKKVAILERGPHFLQKVKISGGGRCNVTHSCFDARELTTRFPRGERALIGAFKRFQASDTVAWFEDRGVRLKTEPDGRMFPITDNSQTVIDCLLHETRKARVNLVTNCGVERTTKTADGFELSLSNGETLQCNQLLLATGGCRTPALGQLAVSLGHSLEAPVPSLFTFHIETPWLRELAGVSLSAAEVSVPSAGLRETGALLITHWGLSGPAILRTSAWGARALHEVDYRFTLQVNWIPRLTAQTLEQNCLTRRSMQPAKLIVNTPISPLSARLWEALVVASGIPRETRWADLLRQSQHRLIQQISRTEFQVTGKSLNKEEFVTCGGIRLNEVDFKTMQSRVCPNLYFAGEVLDIDGITGGFNFQAAWTTGWIAGNAMATS